MGFLTIVATLNRAYPDAVAAVWALVMVPLGLIWYVRRPGTSRPRFVAAVAIAVVAFWAISLLPPPGPT